jgi:NAD(P)-dependent dehydrogenase (short-subunit alcohol dehydrogenase family)
MVAAGGPLLNEVMLEMNTHPSRQSGRVALVTGASRGIGRAAALGLAKDGAAFVGVHYAKSEDAAREVVREIEAVGGRAAAIGADLGLDPAGGARKIAETFCDEVRRHLGRSWIDVLVNNAGIDAHRSIEETDEKTYDALFSVNLKAPFFLVQELLPQFVQGGRIINISTAYTRLAAPKHAAYAAAKGGLNTLTLALAADLGRKNVTVNAVAPAIVETDINAAWLATPGARETANAASVLARVGQTRDIVDVIRFLASDESRWITGQVIEVSGGTRI